MSAKAIFCLKIPTQFFPELSKLSYYDLAERINSLVSSLQGNLRDISASSLDYFFKNN